MDAFGPEVTDASPSSSSSSSNGRNLKRDMSAAAMPGSPQSDPSLRTGDISNASSSQPGVPGKPARQTMGKKGQRQRLAAWGEGGDDATDNVMLSSTTGRGGGGASSSAAGGTGGGAGKPGTFTESLQLDTRYIDEFRAGNFLYLRRKGGTASTAYDLETAEHAQVNPDDYFTMSQHGITHFKGATSEFTSLDRWEREYALFNRVRRIPFFHKYVTVIEVLEAGTRHRVHICTSSVHGILVRAHACSSSNLTRM